MLVFYLLGDNFDPVYKGTVLEKNIQCAKAKRGKFLKAPPAFMVTFLAKFFFHHLKSIYY